MQFEEDLSRYLVIKIDSLDLIFHPHFYNIDRSSQILDLLKVNFINDDTYDSYEVTEIKNEIYQYLININVLSTTMNINHISVNLYKNGNDHMMPYSNNDNNILILLSLGATRKIKFYNKSDIKITYDLDLHHGDLLIIRGETQLKWKYGISKQPKVLRHTINMVFKE